MLTHEKLFWFLGSPALRGCYRAAIIRFEAGKVRHVGREACRMWRYQDLPDRTGYECSDVAHSS